MPQLDSKEQCASFLLTKKKQGFISSETWNKIQKQWKECSKPEHYKNLAYRVYKAIALKNNLIPLSYFSN